MSMGIEEKNPVVLVTGASRGIGEAIASRLADAGWYVAGTATTPSGADAISKRLGEKGFGLVLDSGDSDGVKAVFDALSAGPGSTAGRG